MHNDDSDLLERLRKRFGFPTECWPSSWGGRADPDVLAACDELERLRAVVDEHAKQRHGGSGLCCGLRERQARELKLMRREAAGQRNRADALTHHCTGLEAELERLRDDLSSVRRNLSQLCNAVKRAEGLENWPTIAGDFISYVTGRIDHQARELEQLRAVVARLEPPPGVCEHGVIEGDWCEPCNREYKEAAEAAKESGT